MACAVGTSDSAFFTRKDSECRGDRQGFARRSQSGCRLCSPRPNVFRLTRLRPCVAIPGTFAIAPVKGKVDALKRDYANTTAMIFGTAPEFDEIVASIKQLEYAANHKS
jgi:hypothetical protein